MKKIIKKKVAIIVIIIIMLAISIFIKQIKADNFLKNSGSNHLRLTN